jgi:hypothetical protein
MAMTVIDDTFPSAHFDSQSAYELLIDMCIPIIDYNVNARMIETAVNQMIPYRASNVRSVHTKSGKYCAFFTLHVPSTDLHTHHDLKVGIPFKVYKTNSNDYWNAYLSKSKNKTNNKAHAKKNNESSSKGHCIDDTYGTALLTPSIQYHSEEVYNQSNIDVTESYGLCATGMYLTVPVPNLSAMQLVPIYRLHKFPDTYHMYPPQGVLVTI